MLRKLNTHKKQQKKKHNTTAWKQANVNIKACTCKIKHCNNNNKKKHSNDRQYSERVHFILTNVKMKMMDEETIIAII